MDEDKQIAYGIIGSCIGIAVGFAVGFPIFNLLSYEKRGYIGVPFMLIFVLTLCVAGAAIGIRLGKGNDDPE